MGCINDGNKVKAKGLCNSCYVKEWRKKNAKPGPKVRVLNGLEDDLRPENLETYTGRRPSGSRASDLKKFALEYLPDHITNAEVYEAMKSTEQKDLGWLNTNPTTWKRYTPPNSDVVLVQRPSGKRWVTEHRALMEVQLGRQLESNEYVKHLDGNNLNNDLSNLELWRKRKSKAKVRNIKLYALDLGKSYFSIEDWMGLL